jgi:hypothetical protein
MADNSLAVLALNRTLKGGEEQSSTDELLKDVLTALFQHDVKGSVVGIAGFNIKPRVTSDEGDGEDRPTLRQQIVACDILIIGSPIWLGQPSSEARAGTACGATYWVGEAMGSTDYKDLGAPYAKTAQTTQMLPVNAGHLAHLIKTSKYPGLQTS